MIPEGKLRMWSSKRENASIYSHGDQKFVGSVVLLESFGGFWSRCFMQVWDYERKLQIMAVHHKQRWCFCTCFCSFGFLKNDFYCSVIEVHLMGLNKIGRYWVEAEDERFWLHVSPIVLEATFTNKCVQWIHNLKRAVFFSRGIYFKWLNVFTVVIRAANYLL